jgi:hypothetical protein
VGGKQALGGGRCHNKAPKTFHDTAERGNTAWRVRAIERMIDFDVNCRAHREVVQP